MHKKLEGDLISLAHSILQMKNKENVFLLKQKSKEIYEKLSVLAFVEEYINSTPNLKETKVELLEKVEKAFELKEEISTENEAIEAEFIAEVKNEVEEKVVYNLIDEPNTVEKKEVLVEEKTEPDNEIQNKVQHKKVEEGIEQPFDELEEIMFSKEIPPKNINSESNSTEISDVVKVEERKTMSLEEELQDIISVDVMADLFENVQPKSLNDKLAGNIQIGLNDRIAFVKNLFNNQQEDYNRVVSQLNTFRSENDAKHFINKMVKPDYNWSEQEELETRFMSIIERKFA